MSARTWSDPNLNFRSDGSLDFWGGSKRAADNDTLLGTTSLRKRQAKKDFGVPSPDVVGHQNMSGGEPSAGQEDPDYQAYAGYAGVQPAEEGGCEDHWPTDENEFEDKAEDMEADTKFAVRQTLFLSAMLWGVVFLWGCYKYLPYMWRDVEGDQTDQWLLSLEAKAEEINVFWPKFFRPHAVACGAGGSIFMADRSAIYEGNANGGALQRVECALNGTIADISSACDGSGCWPVALLQRDAGPAKVVSCAHDMAMPLLRDQEPADLVTGFGGTTGGWPNQLLASRNGTIVQYSTSHSDGWSPEWFVGPLNVRQPRSGTGRRRRTATTLRALSTSGNRLLLFYGAATSGVAEAYAERRDVQTMTRHASWSLPESVAPISSGCALDGGNAALVLPESKAQLGAPEPRLVRLLLFA